MEIVNWLNVVEFDCEMPCCSFEEDDAVYAQPFRVSFVGHHLHLAVEFDCG